MCTTPGYTAVHWIQCTTHGYRTRVCLKTAKGPHHLASQQGKNKFTSKLFRIFSFKLGVCAAFGCWTPSWSLFQPLDFVLLGSKHPLFLPSE